MKQLLLLALLVSAASAQIENWQYPIGDDFFPDDTIINQVCITVQAIDAGGMIVKHPVPGVTVVYAPAKVDRTSGFHGHDGDSSIPRPKGIYLSGTNSATIGATRITDANGCARADFQLPGIAGVYTFTISYADGSGLTATKGVNNYVYYHTPTANLVEYQNNPVTNAPQSLHYDNAHYGLTYYFTPAVWNQLQNASLNYRTATSDYGVLDRMDMIRGSLPWGGIADNEFLPTTPWTTSGHEPHNFGVEVDVTNGNQAVNGFFAMEANGLAAENCRLGKYKTGTVSTLADYGYWNSQLKVHVVCTSYSLVAQSGSVYGAGGVGSGRGTGHGK